jgi:hypothetical protein
MALLNNCIAAICDVVKDVSSKRGTQSARHFSSEVPNLFTLALAAMALSKASSTFLSTNGLLISHRPKGLQWIFFARMQWRCFGRPNNGMCISPMVYWFAQDVRFLRFILRIYHIFSMLT